MSNEIEAGSSLKCSNGNFELPKIGATTFKVDQNNPGGGEPGQITATTVGVSLSLASITTEGWARFRNLDSTNYVEWGPYSGETFYPFGRMNPGEPAGPFRLSPGKTYHFKANVASCQVQVQVLED